MKIAVLSLTCAATLVLSGCMSAEEERVLGGALVGAGAGFVTAKILDADNDWVVLSTLAGAGIGALVAQNRRTGECAYNNGDGTYRVGPCS